MPNTPKVQESFGGIKDSERNITVARAQTSDIYDCLNHIMIDDIIKPYETIEISLAIENIKTAMEILEDKKILFIFDRGYPSIWFLDYLNKLGVKYVFRTENQSYKKEKSEMKNNDEYVDLKISNSRLNHLTDEKLKEDLKNNSF